MVGDVPPADFGSKTRQVAYHGAITEKMSIDWIKMRWTLKEIFDEDKRMILVLDIQHAPPRLQGVLKVPESISKTYNYNISLLQRHGVKRIRVERTGGYCQGQIVIPMHNIKVPEPD